LQLADKELENLEVVRNVAGDLRAKQCKCMQGDLTCNCAEGDHFDGIAALHMMVDDRRYGTDDGKIAQFREVCIRQLEKALQGEGSRSRNFDLVYLSAALCDASRYDEARDKTREFLQSFPDTPEKRRRLSKEVQAMIAIATVWHDVAEFALGVRQPLASNKVGERPCELEFGALKYIDGRAFEKLVSRAFARLYHTRGIAPELQKKYETYFGIVLNNIRTASGCAQTQTASSRPTGSAPQ
jgi:hypothetical protein